MSEPVLRKREPLCMAAAPKRLLDEAFTFTHGIRAFNRYCVRRVHDTVKNGIGQCAFADFAVPASCPFDGVPQRFQVSPVLHFP
jgi:hypothetical protein